MICFLVVPKECTPPLIVIIISLWYPCSFIGTKSISVILRLRYGSALTLVPGRCNYLHTTYMPTGPLSRLKDVIGPPSWCLYVRMPSQSETTRCL